MPVTTAANPLRLEVSDLLRRPVGRRDVRLRFRAGELEGGLASGPVAVLDDPDLHVDLVLERIGDGIVVRGSVSGRWRAACSRCLAPVERDFGVRLDELFEREPLEGETYRIAEEHLDLEPAVRDGVLVELPVAPHCRDDCRGLCPHCGADLNTVRCRCATDEHDPRWDALRELQI